jgi:hypothetical protein
MGDLLSIIDFEMGLGVSILGIVLSTAPARCVGRLSLSEPSRSHTLSDFFAVTVRNGMGLWLVLRVVEDKYRWYKGVIQKERPS